VSATREAPGTMESMRTAAIAASVGHSQRHGKGYKGGRGAGSGTVQVGIKDGHAS